MLIDDRVRLSYDDVLIVPGYSRIKSRSQDIDMAVKMGPELLKVPVISSNMDTITGAKMAHYMSSIGAMGVLHRGSKYPRELLETWKAKWDPSLGKIALSVGSTNREVEKERVGELFTLFGDELDQVVLCVDLAHGDSENMTSTLKYIRERGFGGTIIAGAVCTPEGCVRLQEAGADIVRVGIGPGSACSTRIKTGCGYPQLSAVYECAQSGVPVIADGGIREPSDAAKALAVGAKAVMIGGMLRGTDLTPHWGGEGSPVPFRGMASNDAKTNAGIAAGYEEGISTSLPGKPEGSTGQVIKGICDGIESAMSYVGATTVDEFTKLAKLVRISPSVTNENRPHAVV